MTTYREKEELGSEAWGYWQGKPYAPNIESPTHRFFRRAIATVLVAGVFIATPALAMYGPSFDFLGPSKQRTENPAPPEGKKLDDIKNEQTSKADSIDGLTQR